MTSTVTGWPLSVRTAVGKLKRRRMSSTSHGGHLSNSGQHGMSSNLVSVVVVSFSTLVAPYLFPCGADTFRFRLNLRREFPRHTVTFGVTTANNATESELPGDG